MFCAGFADWIRRPGSAIGSTLKRDNMTGSGVLGWRFRNRTPLWFKLIVGLLMADSALHFGLLFTVSSWARRLPDAIHSYRVPFRDGGIYFVQPWLGWYLDAKWIGFGLVAFLLLLLVLNRGHIERGH
jgi:hypothetical protein